MSAEPQLRRRRRPQAASSAASCGPPSPTVGTCRASAAGLSRDGSRGHRFSGVRRVSSSPSPTNRRCFGPEWPRHGPAWPELHTTLHTCWTRHGMGPAGKWGWVGRAGPSGAKWGKWGKQGQATQRILAKQVGAGGASAASGAEWGQVGQEGLDGPSGAEWIKWAFGIDGNTFSNGNGLV